MLGKKKRGKSRTNFLGHDAAGRPGGGPKLLMPDTALGARRPRIARRCRWLAHASAAFREASATPVVAHCTAPPGPAILSLP